MKKFLLLIFLLFQILLSPQLNPEVKILKSLTLEQKIGQLLIIGFEEKSLTPQLENLIEKIQPGGILLLDRNIENKDQLKRLIEGLQKVSLKNTGLPLFVAVDQEGEISRIKFAEEKTSQFKIRDFEQAFDVGLKRGLELRESGINLNLAPVLDITQSGDFLDNRSFKRDFEETGKLAKGLILGQKEGKILTAIKHFPGYGGISFNPEREKLAILEKIPEISQFEIALEGKPEMIMTANVIYKDIDEKFPFTLSQKGIKFLKERLKNDFLIISDDLSSPILKKNFSLKNSVILAKKAGIDILLIAGFDEPEDPFLAFNFLLEAIKNGQISEKNINQSILKIIKFKQKLLE